MAKYSATDKGGLSMKLLIGIQRVLAALVLVVGLFFLFSETPLSEGFTEQLWTTAGGFTIVILAALWAWLIDKEEGYFIHEAR